MYCPSCDKKYGAIHSRCPECHSWLKVSAPASSRAKSKAAAPAPVAATPKSGGAVSTLDRDEGISWADPAPTSGGSQWAGDDSSSDSWSGASATPSDAGKSASDWGADCDSGSRSDSWGGQDSASSWGGATETAAPSGGESGWLSGGESTAAPTPKAEADGWSTGGLGGGSLSTPATPKSNGWLGDSPSSAPAGPSSQGNGWLGDSATSTGGLSAGSSSGSSSSGWLGGDASAQEAPQAGRGWLGDGPSEPSARSGGESGWLDGSQGGAPSMTEMVDHAISVEDEDEFVDDSWVDEEIRDNEFDELEVPEYVPPAPEVGGAFLKMLLVAVLVVLVGGGVLFLRGDSKTPEELAAEKAEQQLAFARGAVKEGKKDLAAGRAQLAVPQFQEALTTLSGLEVPKEEIYDTEILLSKALMESEDYEDAIKHWRSLKESGDEKVIAEAQKGIQDSARQLRISANNMLKEAKTYANKGEVNAVARLGRDSLKIYKSYGGNAAQKGNAHGMIGRSYLNGRNYGSAKDHLKKAVALAPGLGYEKYLNEANAKIQPTSYIKPMAAPRRTRQPVAPPSFDIGAPSYQTNTNRYSGGGGRRSSQAPSTSAPSAPAPTRMKEIPAYRPSNRSNGSSGGRKGTKGVLRTY